MICRRVFSVGLLALAAAESSERSGCDPGRLRVAIDVGHYIAKPGATSATGVTEFEYNRTLARQALAALQKVGFMATFLIGESGKPLPLEERTRIARVAGASLFISLHHDSVQRKYLSDWMVEGKPEKYSDIFHGYSLFVSGRNTHFAESREFAVLLGQALLGEGLTPSLHHAEKIHEENHPLLDTRLGVYQFDDLVVLRSASIPAVLLESAIIVNRAEEKRVQSGEYHRHVIAALVRAIEGYCRMAAVEPLPEALRQPKKEEEATPHSNQNDRNTAIPSR